MGWVMAELKEGYGRKGLDFEVLVVGTLDRRDLEVGTAGCWGRHMAGGLRTSVSESTAEHFIHSGLTSCVASASTSPLIVQAVVGPRAQFLSMWRAWWKG